MECLLLLPCPSEMLRFSSLLPMPTRTRFEGVSISFASHRGVARVAPADQGRRKQQGPQRPIGARLLDAPAAKYTDEPGGRYRGGRKKRRACTGGRARTVRSINAAIFVSAGMDLFTWWNMRPETQMFLDTYSSRNGSCPPTRGLCHCMELCPPKRGLVNRVRAVSRIAISQRVSTRSSLGWQKSGAMWRRMCAVSTT